jgi:hypothetical protein
MPTFPFGDKGPCEIVWGYGDSGAAYLGKTAGDVKITGETNVSDINEDQAGDAAVNAILTGTTLTVEVPLTRLTLDQLAKALGVTKTGHKVPLENQVGCDLYALSKAMVIKPLCGNAISTDPTKWIHLYKTYPIANLDLTFNKDTQRIINVKFKVFVCQESADGIVGNFGTLGMDSGASVM